MNRGEKMETNIYLELYLFDFLTKTHDTDAELWGERSGSIFYINQLYESGNGGIDEKRDRRTLRAEGKTYLGQFEDLRLDEEQGKWNIIYEQSGLLYTKSVTVYISDQTDKLEEFVLAHIDVLEQEIHAVEIRTDKEEPALQDERQKKRGLLMTILQISGLSILNFLCLNLITSLGSYQEMTEVLKVFSVALLLSK